MTEPCLESMTMDEIMRRWPATIRIVLRHHLHCVGCPIAQFHTLDDAIREHGIDGALLQIFWMTGEVLRSRLLRGLAFKVLVE